jgi:hypothetical protein
MARTAITTNLLTSAGNFVDPAGTATTAGAGNGVSVAGVGSNPVHLRVANASGGSGTVSILAGSQPGQISSGQGPLVVTVASATTQWVGPFESARFQQALDSLYADTSVVMTITAFQTDTKHS